MSAEKEKDSVSISNYFTPLADREKRPSPSTSSEDNSPHCKKALTLSSPDSNKTMDENSVTLKSLKDSLHCMQLTLSTLASKDDIKLLRDEVRGEMDKMRHEISCFSKTMEKFDDKLVNFEGRLLEIEIENDKITKENTFLRRECNALNDRLVAAEGRINDQEQYERRFNLRVFNLDDDPNETAQETTKKVCDKLTSVMGVATTPDDIEACHRLPLGRQQPAQTGAPATPTGAGAGTTASGDGTKDSAESDTAANTGPKRPVIIRFKSRMHRDNVYQKKKFCKNKGFSISEDLTRANAELCKKVYKHPNCDSSWTIGGKVFAKLTNGKQRVRVPFGSNIDDVFRMALRN